MTGFRVTAICLAAVAASCAGSQNRPVMDQRVTRIDEVKSDAAEPAPPPEPAAPKVDAAVPGPDWFMQRDVSIDPNIPPAPVLLVNPSDGVKATVFVILFPAVGDPKVLAAEQRKVFIREDIKCSKIAVSEDGRVASFTTVVKRNDGTLRSGKVTFLTRPTRSDAVVAMFGSWEPKSDKASLADMATIETSITVK